MNLSCASSPVLFAALRLSCLHPLARDIHSSRVPLAAPWIATPG